MSEIPSAIGDIAAIIGAYDTLAEQAERHLQHLEAEHPTAQASGDPRYVYRVERGITWTRDLLDALDEKVLQRIFDLRHNASQLEVAREGKMV